MDDCMDSQKASPPKEKLEKLNYYRNEDRHEWSLLSNRLSSYITSQSFLLTSYAIAMGNLNPDAKWRSLFTLIFPSLVCLLGVATSWRAYPGITGAMEIIKLWHRKERRLFLVDADATQDDAPRDLAMIDFQDDRPRTRNHLLGAESIDDIHERSLYFAKMAPWVFGVGWFLFFLLAVGLHNLS